MTLSDIIHNWTLAQIRKPVPLLPREAGLDLFSHTERENT